MPASAFETSRPVDGALFVNRESELARLDTALDKLAAGRSAYFAVLGLRKVGKTSLFHEWMRRNSNRRSICFVPVQCWARPNPDDFFREYLRLTINAVLQCKGMVSETGIIAPEAAADQVMDALSLTARRGATGLEEALRLLGGYGARQDRATAYREAARMPETLALAEGVRLQFVLDEFQEMARLDGFRTVKQGLGSVYAMLREEWQLQRHCNYVVSGSSVSMLRQLLEDPSAPFFQHFTTLNLGPLPREEAVDMVASFSRRSGTPVPEALCRRVVDLIGTNPYYLQVLGEELVWEAAGGSVTDATWKLTCQRVLFASSGRLHEYFEWMHGKAVGGSSVLESIVVALAEGPRSGSEIARSLGVAQNRLGSKLPLLEARDVIHRDNGVCALRDPCYALWLRSARAKPPRVLAPLLLGDESEQNVAREMARQGLSLVYQSRASRRAFDLLALYHAHEIGVQVRRIKRFPGYVSERLLGRMRREARELGWYSLMAFDCDGQVSFHVPSSGRKTKRGRRFDGSSAVRHVLDVLDRPPTDE